MMHFLMSFHIFTWSEDTCRCLPEYYPVSWHGF